MQEEHDKMVPAEGGMAILSAHLDFDLSRLPPDALHGRSDGARTAASQDEVSHGRRYAP